VHHEELKKSLQNGEKIVFMDSVHPTHQTRPFCGWIRKGLRKELPTNAGQKRMNIVGALGLETMDLFVQEFETVNHEAIILFLKNLPIKNPCTTAIHIVLDSARDLTCPEILQYVKTSCIRLHHLPPYSPNLNVIERCWKIMHELVTDNHYYPTFKAFADATLDFLTKTFSQKAYLWTDRRSDNCPILWGRANPSRVRGIKNWRDGGSRTVSLSY
jgi:transposase